MNSTLGSVVPLAMFKHLIKLLIVCDFLDWRLPQYALKLQDWYTEASLSYQRSAITFSRIKNEREPTHSNSRKLSQVAEMMIMMLIRVNDDFAS